jgi:hypothetical protein
MKRLALLLLLAACRPSPSPSSDLSGFTERPRRFDDPDAGLVCYYLRDWYGPASSCVRVK